MSSTTVLFLTSARDGSYLRGRQITLPHTDFSPLPNFKTLLTSCLLPSSPRQPTTWPGSRSQRILPTGLGRAEQTEGWGLFTTFKHQNPIKRATAHQWVPKEREDKHSKIILLNLEPSLRISCVVRPNAAL